ncbi:MAG: bifunctional serine/threonine-protein kinase/formylglycine-generating enzyme family protein [Chlamydiota bacterium]
MIKFYKSVMDSIGDYYILQNLGRNAFADVYLAEHRLMKKTFAIKVLAPSLVADPTFVERFEKNVSSLAQLDHPSIVKIHNISFADGKYFIVMDPIVDQSGQVMNLDSYLDLQGTVLSESEIEQILLQVGSALDYAHTVTKGDGHWIHGALKLSNILVQKKDRSLQVFLSDFGLMQLLGIGRCLLQAYVNIAESFQSEKGMEDYKHYRSYIRNFHFLAPEQKQCLSNAQQDSRSDVYAFGVLAYYLLTKEFPEAMIEPIAKLAPTMHLSWDLLLRYVLDKDPAKRPAYIEKTMQDLLHKKADDTSSSSTKEENTPSEEKNLTLFPWKAIEKRVEDKMQMSFPFERAVRGEKPSAYYAFPAPPSALKPVINPPKIERPIYEPDPGAIFQRELSVSRYEPTKVEIREVEPIFSEMVIIPGGTYFRGSNTGARDEMPRHAVTLSSFAIDIHPVTNEQFVRFLMAMGGEKDGNNNDIIRLRDSRIKKTAGKFIIESGYNKHPVVGVTWYGSVAYAKWIGKRLPTEAEWEVAGCGGKDTGVYPTGDQIERNQANFFSSDTTPVMSYPAGFFSLYDMAGNVYEWCEDWYAYNYYDASLQEPENPKGPLQGVYRVLRGGCWKSLKEDLRYSHRHRNNPGTVNRTYGFRCAADVH